jgi:hypothetical protein
MIKRLTDKQVAAVFHTSDRNLQQTYKSPHPTKTKLDIRPEEVSKKLEQYQVIRLGATCLQYGFDEEQLLRAIDFLKSSSKA